MQHAARGLASCTAEPKGPLYPVLISHPSSGLLPSCWVSQWERNPESFPTCCQAGRRRPRSEMMLPPRKTASCSYGPGNPAASNLSNIIFNQVLLNTLTPREARYLQPGFRDSPELMDSTPLSEWAEISHKAASPSCPIFPLLLLFSHRVILLQQSAKPMESNTKRRFSKLCPSCWMLTSLPWPTSC